MPREFLATCNVAHRPPFQHQIPCLHESRVCTLTVVHTVPLGGLCIPTLGKVAKPGTGHHPFVGEPNGPIASRSRRVIRRKSARVVHNTCMWHASNHTLALDGPCGKETQACGAGTHHRVCTSVDVGGTLATAPTRPATQGRTGRPTGRRGAFASRRCHRSKMPRDPFLLCRIGLLIFFSTSRTPSQFLVTRLDSFDKHTSYTRHCPRAFSSHSGHGHGTVSSARHTEHSAASHSKHRVVMVRQSTQNSSSQLVHS